MRAAFVTVTGGALALLILSAGRLAAVEPSPPGDLTTSTAASEVPAPGTPEHAPGTLQALIDRAEVGSTVNVPPGLYRELVTVGKQVRIRGAGAEIRGSDVWTRWVDTGTSWRSAEIVPDLYTGGTCAEARCAWPEQVFLDGVPLTQVAAGPGPGEFARDATSHLLLGEDPSGRMVEVSTRQHWLVAEATDVTIEGFVMSHVASAAQFGGIHAGALGSRLNISDVTLSDAHGALVSFHDNRGGSLIDSTLKRAGQVGVKGGGVESGVRDLSIRRNTITGNNTEGFDTGWESGGIKLTDAVSPEVVDNEVADNIGPGIWCDIDCTDVVITGNRVYGNSRAGIMFEISDGATIADNVVANNGWGFSDWGWGAGILVSSSAAAVVHNNVVAWNADGIAVVSQDRDGTSSDSVRDNVVQSNTIVGGPPGAYLLSWLEDWDSGMEGPEAGNRGADNRFWITPRREHPCQFLWLSCAGGVDDFAATPGGAGSKLLAAAEASEVLEAAGLELPDPADLYDPPQRPSPFLLIFAAGLLGVGVVVAFLVRRHRRHSAV